MHRAPPGLGRWLLATVAIAVTAVVAVVGTRAGLGYLGHAVFEDVPGTMSAYQYFELQPDMLRADALRLVGEPSTQPVDFPAPTAEYPDRSLVTPPPRSTCEYWAEAGALQDIGALRVCYVDGRVVQRASYDVEEAHLLVVWSGRPWEPYIALTA